jgi:Tat protein secretion system quality control protein TatD with DNase activity
VVRKLAELRGIDEGAMGRITAENTRRCFRLPA